MNREYLDYLASAQWRAMRQRVLIRDKYACVRCGHVSRNNDVHHKTYARFKRELTKDLETLCRDCHERLHDQLRRKGMAIPRTDDAAPVKSAALARKNVKLERKLAEAKEKLMALKAQFKKAKSDQPRRKRKYVPVLVLK